MPSPAQSFIKIFKTNSLPQVLEGHSIYLVPSGDDPSQVEFYVTTADGLSAKHIINANEVQSMIDASISANSALEIVDDISARDELPQVNGKLVLVLDATGDETVNSGSATYVWRSSNTSWIKLTEYESLDVVLEWSAIQNKPSSSVADIDEAVDLRHTHTNNLFALEKINEDSDGNFIYNGEYLRAPLEIADW